MPGHPTYVILLNLGGREEWVDVTQLTKHFGANVKIAAAGADTHFNQHDVQPTKNVLLWKHDAIVLTNGVSAMVSSIIFVILIAIIGRFIL